MARQIWVAVNAAVLGGRIPSPCQCARPLKERGAVGILQARKVRQKRVQARLGLYKGESAQEVERLAVGRVVQFGGGLKNVLKQRLVGQPIASQQEDAPRVFIGYAFERKRKGGGDIFIVLCGGGMFGAPISERGMVEAELFQITRHGEFVHVLQVGRGKIERQGQSAKAIVQGGQVGVAGVRFVQRAAEECERFGQREDMQGNFMQAEGWRPIFLTRSDQNADVGVPQTRQPFCGGVHVFEVVEDHQARSALFPGAHGQRGLLVRFGGPGL